MEPDIPLHVALFSEHRGDPLSWAINTFTWGEHCHAAFYFSDSADLVEAYWPKVRQRKLAKGEADNIDFFQIRGLTRDGSARIRSYCDLAIKNGERYSIPGLFRFMSLPRLFLGEGVNGEAKYPTFCSQFVMDACVNADGIHLLNAPGYKINPTLLGYSPDLIKVPAPV